MVITLIFVFSLMIFSKFTLNNPKVLEYPRKVSVEFLQYLQKHEYDEAISLLSEDAQKKMNKDVLKARWEKVLRQHGEIKGWQVLSMGFSSTTAGFRYGVGGGANDKSNYDATVYIDLEAIDAEQKKWEIVEVNISP